MANGYMFVEDDNGQRLCRDQYDFLHWSAVHKEGLATFFIDLDESPGFLELDPASQLELCVESLRTVHVGFLDKANHSNLKLVKVYSLDEIMLPQMN